jgi:hypothetical protein
MSFIPPKKHGWYVEYGKTVKYHHGQRVAVDTSQHICVMPPPNIVRSPKKHGLYFEDGKVVNYNHGRRVAICLNQYTQEFIEEKTNQIKERSLMSKEDV